MIDGFSDQTNKTLLQFMNWQKDDCIVSIFTQQQQQKRPKTNLFDFDFIILKRLENK